MTPEIWSPQGALIIICQFAILCPNCWAIPQQQPGCPRRCADFERTLCIINHCYRCKSGKTTVTFRSWDSLSHPQHHSSCPHIWDSCAPVWNITIPSFLMFFDSNMSHAIAFWNLFLWIHSCGMNHNPFPRCVDATVSRLRLYFLPCESTNFV